MRSRRCASSHSTSSAFGPRNPMIGMNSRTWSGASSERGQRGRQLLEHDVCSRRASGAPEAQVRAAAEREVLVRVGAPDVETVGVSEHVRIPVGRADAHEHVALRGDRDLADRGVDCGSPSPVDDRRVVAQHLLDCARNQRSSGPSSPPRSRELSSRRRRLLPKMLVVVS